MAGPYTERAIGEPVVPDAMLPTPVADAPGLGMRGDTTSGLSNAQYGVDLRAPGVAWSPSNQDLMPGMRPLHQANTAWGDPLLDAGGAIVPATHIANRLAKLDQDEAELRRKAAEWDPLKGLGQTALAYQENFNQIGAKELNGLYDEAVQFYGDPIVAQQELRNPNSTFGRRWKSTQADLTLLGKQGLDIVDNAMGI